MFQFCGRNQILGRIKKFNQKHSFKIMHSDIIDNFYYLMPFIVFLSSLFGYYKLTDLYIFSTQHLNIISTADQ